MVFGMASCSRFEVLIDCKTFDSDSNARYLISNQELKNQGGGVAQSFKTDDEGYIHYRRIKEPANSFYFYNKKFNILISSSTESRDKLPNYAVRYTCTEVK